MSRTSYIASLRALFHIPARKPAIPGTVTVKNSRSSIQPTEIPLCPGAARLVELSQARNAFINLGLENHGVSGELAEPAFSPANFDRCVLITLDSGKTVLVAKGAGLRGTKGAYLEMEGITRLSGMPGIYKPIDLNPNPADLIHPLVGGSSFKALISDAAGATTMLFLAQSLGTAEPIGGQIYPLAMRQLKTFPVIIGGRLKLVRGWNFFTSQQYMSRQQLLNMVNLIEKEPGVSARLIARFKKYVAADKKVPLLLRWLVGRAFMKTQKPAVYEYICAKGSFRIGHLYDQLVTNRSGAIRNRLLESGAIKPAGRLSASWPTDPEQWLAKAGQQQIKTYLDKKLTEVYGLFDKKVSLPDRTDHDLRTEDGRAAYLRQVFLHKNNAAEGESLACAIASEIGRQLGILHGSGGHAGGHVYLHHLGQIELILEHRTEKTRLKITLSTKDPQDKYDRFDLADYRVVKMTAGESGAEEFGAVGGGSTRPDNVGYGLRDLCTVSSSIDKTLRKIVFRYPQIIGGLEIDRLLDHFHTKLVQQADLDMLFVIRFRPEVAAQGGFSGDSDGAFPQLIRALGGDQETFSAVKAAFDASYQKYYALSKQKHALIHFRELDGAPGSPRLSFHSPAEDGGTEQFIGAFLAPPERKSQIA